MEEFRDVQKLLQDKSNKEIAEGAVEITKLLNASLKILNVSRGLPAWKLYVEYVNEIVMEGFSKTILASVAYLNDQVDPEIIAKNESVPLLAWPYPLVHPPLFSSTLNTFVAETTQLKSLKPPQLIPRKVIKLLRKVDVRYPVCGRSAWSWWRQTSSGTRRSGRAATAAACGTSSTAGWGRSRAWAR